jgi:hypothetical protein
MEQGPWEPVTCSTNQEIALSYGIWMPIIVLIRTRHWSDDDDTQVTNSTKQNLSLEADICSTGQ